MAKTDILFIHGGMTFKTQADYLEYLSKFKSIYLEEKVTWSGKYLSDSLGNKFRVIRPNMPLKDNAKYEDWKIFFERHLPLLNKNYILILKKALREVVDQNDVVNPFFNTII